MNNANASASMGPGRSSKSHISPRLWSPYAHWYDIADLEAERERLMSLPPAQFHTAIIRRWRRGQVYLINQRIRFLQREAQFNGA